MGDESPTSAPPSPKAEEERDRAILARFFFLLNHLAELQEKVTNILSHLEMDLFSISSFATIE